MKSKIAFLIHGLNAGGMERVMSELVNNFCSKENVEVHLLLYGKSRELFYTVSDKVIIHIPNFPFSDENRLISTFKTVKYLRSRIKAINPTVILSFGEIWNSLVLISLAGLKQSIFVSDRCKPDKSFGFFNDLIRKIVYPSAKGIIAQTEKAKEIYFKQFRNDNIQIIGNPIRNIDENKQSHTENIVISVGRLIDSKHFDRLIDIFYKINLPDWKLVIIGGDALKQNNLLKLKQKIETLNLNEKVELLGSIKNVDEYLLKSKIFAFTSSSEGFPNVIGEAMSAGLPAVAYDCIAGPSEMIENGINGYLIPLFDDELFQLKLKYLMMNDAERIIFGQNAKKSIKSYSVKSITDRYYHFLLPQEV